MTHTICEISTKNYERGLKLVGGSLCLDYVNSTDWRRTKKQREWIKSYAMLVTWSVYAGAIGDNVATNLLSRAAREPDAASVVHARALALRESLYDLFHMLVPGGRPAAGYSEEVSGFLAPLLSMTQLAPGSPLSITWAGEPEALERPLWPIAWSVIDTVRMQDFTRLKECKDPDCRWVFFDLSRNRSRRWCDMGNCGNLAKFERFRARRSGRTARSVRMR